VEFLKGKLGNKLDYLKKFNKVFIVISAIIQQKSPNKKKLIKYEEIVKEDEKKGKNFYDEAKFLDFLKEKHQKQKI